MSDVAATGAPTEAERIRRLPWVVASGGLNAFFAMLTFGSSVFVLYLSELGLAKAGIGFMVALFPFCGIVAPLLSSWVARFGLKRTFLVFFGARKFVIVLLVLAPWVGARFGASVLFAYAAAVILTFALCRAIGETGYYPWNQEFVPDRIRGKFSGISSVVTTLMGVLAMALASWVIRGGGGPARFAPLILVASVAGVISVALMVPVPGGAPIPPRANGATHRREMLGALRDRTFTSFMIGVTFAIFGLSTYAFLPLFIKEQAGLPAERIVLLDAAAMAGGLVSSYFWGWAADRYGGKPVTLVGTGVQGLVPVLWLFVPGVGPQGFAVGVGLAVVTGVASMANTIGSFRWFLNHVVPPEKSTAYTSVWYAWSGIAGGLAPLLGGQLLDACRTADLDVGGLIVNDVSRDPRFDSSMDGAARGRLPPGSAPGPGRDHPQHERFPALLVLPGHPACGAVRQRPGAGRDRQHDPARHEVGGEGGRGAARSL